MHSIFSALTDVPDSSIYDDVTAVILAGGEGRRFGGTDKGLILLNGKPLVRHVIDRVRPQVSDIIIAANRNLAEYESFGYKVHPDAYAGFQGPLQGFLTGLCFSETEYVLTVPCDCPFLPQFLVLDMFDEMRLKRADLVVASCGGRLHPTFTLMKRSLRDSLKVMLAQGVRKIDMWLPTVALAVCEFKDEHEFMNINTPEELASSENSSL